MSVTPNRSIPLVEEGTLDNSSAVNDALQVIDALLQCAVISMAETDAPATGEDGDLYIVAGLGGVATGDWAGHEGELARLVEIEGGISWQYYTPGAQVFLVLDRSSGILYRYEEGSPTGWGLAAFAPYVPVENISAATTVATPSNYNRYMRFSHATAQLHFEEDGGYIEGAEYHVRKTGVTGTLEITADTGFTINVPFRGSTEIPPGGTATIKIVGPNEADLFGVTSEGS